MINQEKHARILAGEEFRDPDEGRFPELEVMDMGEMLALHAEIERRLPARDLSQMNLERELVLQYLKVSALQEKVLADERIPANQRAQVTNAVASTLQHLVTMQTKFHTSERLKEIEARLIRALEKVPAEHLVEFFAWYEAEEAANETHSGA